MQRGSTVDLMVAIMGIHWNVACASLEIQIIGNLFWTLEVNCRCILVSAQYCFLIKKIWLYCRILNIQDRPKRISLARSEIDLAFSSTFIQCHECVVSVGGSCTGSFTVFKLFFILQPVQVLFYILQWRFGFTFYILKKINFTVKFYQGNLTYEVSCYRYLTVY